MGFGTELWDQVPAVEQFSQDGVHLADQTRGFFAKTATENQQQAKDIEKLVHSYMPTTSKKQPQYVHDSSLRTTLLAAWMSILQEKKNAANEHTLNAERLDRNVIENLRDLSRENANKRQRLLDDINRMRDEMQGLNKKLDTTRVQYEKKARKGMDAKCHFEQLERDLKTNRHDLDKARTTSERRQSKASAAEHNYRRAILDVNERQRHYFHQDLRDALDAMEQMERDRIGKMKETFNIFISSEVTMLDNLREISLRMSHAVQLIDKDRDILLFIQESRTGENVPEEMGFLPYNPSLGRVPVYGSSLTSTSRGSLLGKRDLRPVDLADMPKERQVRVLESKIKELQIEKAEVEKKKIDTELCISDVGPTDALRTDHMRTNLENQDIQLGRLNENIRYYGDLIDKLDRGESIQPQPMAGVGVPAAIFGGLTSGEGISSEGTAPPAPAVASSTGMPPQTEPTGVETDIGQKEADRSGVVDRFVNIFHPREP